MMSTITECLLDRHWCSLPGAMHGSWGYNILDGSFVHSVYNSKVTFYMLRESNMLLFFKKMQLINKLTCIVLHRNSSFLHELKKLESYDMGELWVLNTKRVGIGVSVAEYNKINFMLSLHKLKAESCALFAYVVHGQWVFGSCKCFVALFCK